MIDRLLQIETVLAHLQHDVDSLNRSLATHFRRLQEIDDLPLSCHEPAATGDSL